MITNKQALREAAEKATPGPWRAFRYDSGICGVGGGESFEILVCERISSNRPEDAKFIAVAHPAAVLALLDELEAAYSRNAELEAFIKTSCDVYNGDGSYVSDSYTPAHESPLYPRAAGITVKGDSE